MLFFSSVCIQSHVHHMKKDFIALWNEWWKGILGVDASCMTDLEDENEDEDEDEEREGEENLKGWFLSGTVSKRIILQSPG